MKTPVQCFLTSRITFVCILCCLTFFGSAQEIERSVISSTGGSYDGDFSIEWTIGEAFTKTLTNGFISVTQGFHQSDDKIKPLSALSPNARIDVFPNPASDFLSVELPNNGTSYEYVLINLDGRVVQKGQTNKNISLSLDLTREAIGIHFLRFIDENGDSQTFKISILK